MLFVGHFAKTDPECFLFWRPLGDSTDLGKLWKCEPIEQEQKVVDKYVSENSNSLRFNGHFSR